MNPSVRGACPGIAAPMRTGDGLLARLIPNDPVGIDSFAALCTAAESHGNGIMEVTQRGSLQIRGLTETSAPEFARVAIEIGIGAEGGPPILASPLIGLDALEIPGTHIVVKALREAMLDPPESLGPKVSVLIDSGGDLHLDAVPADIRLRATREGGFHAALAGDALTARHLGWIEARDVNSIVTDLLTHIANRGVAARARDFTGELDFSSLCTRFAARLMRGPPPMLRPSAEPIALHPLAGGIATGGGCESVKRSDLRPLGSGSFARGFALAFGHASAANLRSFACAAAELGATSIRPAPGRALLVIGLSEAAANDLCATAEALGLVAQPDDSRRYIVACAGAPACASATFPTRELAPEIARVARKWVDRSTVVHLSGCTKGCAHPGPAALTVAGPDRLILGGRADDAPHGTISPAGLIAGIERLCREIRGV